MPSWVDPTAQTSSAEAAETAYSTLRVSPAGFGLGTMLQPLPSWCWVRVRLTKGGPSGSWDQPTAHASLSESAATPRSWLVSAVEPATFGLASRSQPPETGGTSSGQLG